MSGENNREVVDRPNRFEPLHIATRPDAGTSSCAGGEKSRLGACGPHWVAVQGADESIEHPRLMLGVELLFKPRAGSHRRGRKIEKAGHGVVNRLGRAARVHAPIRHAASLEKVLCRRIRLNEGQNWPPDLQIFEELPGNLNSGLWLQQQ